VSAVPADRSTVYVEGVPHVVIGERIVEGVPCYLVAPARGTGPMRAIPKDAPASLAPVEDPGGSAVQRKLSVTSPGVTAAGTNPQHGALVEHVVTLAAQLHEVERRIKVARRRAAKDAVDKLAALEADKLGRR
jgi:hypothetical protein